MTFADFQIPLSFLVGFLTCWALNWLCDLFSDKKYHELMKMLDEANVMIDKHIESRRQEINAQQNAAAQ